MQTLYDIIYMQNFKMLSSEYNGVCHRVGSGGGKSHVRRSLVGCSPGGCEESDTTERLHFHFSLSYIGEGNGNPLQCSCLESPRDGGAWWAAVSGVTQSRTRLKRAAAAAVMKQSLLAIGFSWGN